MEDVGYYKDFIGRRECDYCHMTFRHLYEVQMGAFTYHFHLREEWIESRDNFNIHREEGRPDMPLTNEGSSVTLEE
jgi:hypothetical protein